MTTNGREDEAMAAFLLTVSAAAVAAWFGASRGLHLFLSFAMTLTLGAVIGAGDTEEEPESVPRMAIPFYAVGGILALTSIVALFAYPIAGAPVIGITALGPVALIIGFLFLAGGAAVEDARTEGDSVPDDPEAVLDDGGEA